MGEKYSVCTLVCCGARADSGPRMRRTCRNPDIFGTISRMKITNLGTKICGSEPRNSETSLRRISVQLHLLASIDKAEEEKGSSHPPKKEAGRAANVGHRFSQLEFQVNQSSANRNLTIMTKFFLPPFAFLLLAYSEVSTVESFSLAPTTQAAARSWTALSALKPPKRPEEMMSHDGETASMYDTSVQKTYG